VLLKLRIPAKGNGSQFSPNVYAGPQAGIKAGCSVKSTATSDCGTFGATFKSTDFSVVFGAGVDIGRAVITARYDMSLGSFDSQPPTDNVKNSAFYLLAGWTFRSPR